MKRTLYVSLFAACLSAGVLQGQPGRDFSGHWVGVINMPIQDVSIEFDFQKDQDGRFGGTASMPGEKLGGVVLRGVSFEGASVKFHARSDQRFEGELAPNGEKLVGDFFIDSSAVPFELTRKGPARTTLAAMAASRELEGSWSGTLEAGGTQERVELRISPFAHLILLDEGGLTVQVSKLEQSGSAVKLEIGVGLATYSASLQAGELTGTYHTGQLELPLKLHRTLSNTP
jgi:hypothetical protein